MAIIDPGDPLSLVTPISEEYISYTSLNDSNKEEAPFIGSLGERFTIHDVRYGGMGEVFLCSFVNEQQKERMVSVAMKSIQKQFFFDPLYRISFENEAVNWSRLSGLPNIMPIMNIEEIDNRVFLMLPCVNNKNKINTLRDELNSTQIHIKVKLRHFFQGLLGMMYATQKFDGLVHGDLKPENMMILHDNVFVSDFGLSKTFNELEKPRLKINLESTWAYRAPELWKGSIKQSMKSDIYSFGIILYEILAGCLPFNGSTKSGWEQAHTTAIPLNVRFSNQFENLSGFFNLALKCLNKDPHNRPDYNQLFTEFNDCWEKLDFIEHFMIMYDQAHVTSSFASLQKVTKPPIIQGLLKLERPDLALAEIENLASENITPEILRAKGTSLSLLNRDEEAITIFNELLALNISEDLKVECLNELGLSYKRTYRFKEAETIYLDKLLPIIKKDDLSKTITNLGTVYISEKKFDKAIDCLLPMMRESPNNYAGWANLGFAYKGKKDFESAADCFKKTLVLKPNASNIQVELARVYLQIGMAEEAYALLDSAWNQGYNTVHWLENMMIACFATKREEELRELAKMALSEFGEQKGQEIFSRVSETIKTIADNDKTDFSEDEENREATLNQDNEEPDAVDTDTENGSGDSNAVNVRPAGFSMPFLNYRFYIGDNSFSIDFYYRTKTDSYAEQFRQSYMQAKNDPRIQSGNMRLRATIFYFTECPQCSIQILTNRDQGKNIACRRCDFRFPTNVKTSAFLDSLLQRCMEVAELSIVKDKGQSIVMIAQPRKGDNINALKTYFINDGYSERVTVNNKLILYLFEEMVKRRLFTREEQILAFSKDFSTEIVSYQDQTPAEVDLFIRKVKSEFPNLRSASTMYETHPDDVGGLMYIGKYHEALIELEKHLNVTPSDYHLLTLKIYLFYELGRTSEAITIASELLKKNTSKADAWVLMGEALLKAKEYKQAIHYLEQGTKMDPLNPSPLVKLAICYKETLNEKEMGKVMLKLKSLGMV